MSPPTPPQVGDTVFYVPDRIHELDCDHEGKPVFHFAFARAGRVKKRLHQAGDAVPHEAFKEMGRFRRRQGDRIETQGGHHLQVGGPRFAWKATVREVFADGTVALDIVHPRGWPTLHYPKQGQTTGLHYDASGNTPHTWHLPSDEPAQKGA